MTDRSKVKFLYRGSRTTQVFINNSNTHSYRVHLLLSGDFDVHFDHCIFFSATVIILFHFMDGIIE